MNQSDMEQKVEIKPLKEPSIFCYKQTATSSEKDGKFVAFHASDISSLDQGFMPINPDTIETKEYVCLILKGGIDATQGHYHLDATFNEVMLRWMAWSESHNA